MASIGYVNGSDFGIYVDDVLIGVGLDNQIQKTRNMINVSNKDSGGDAEYIPGRKDGTWSGSARIKYDAGFGFDDLNQIYEDGTLVTLRYSNETDGDIEYQNSGYLSELSRQDPDDDSASVDYTFQKTGAETSVAYTAGP